MTISPVAKWAIGLTVLGFAGAALFYSPYVGFNGQPRLACPLCPNITGEGAPQIKFIRYTLIGGFLNSAMLLVAGGVVRALVIGWQELRTYWT